MKTSTVVALSLALSSTLLLATNLAAAPAPAPGASAASAATMAKTTNPDRRVEEDDQVRIEETRSRGESQRIVVKPKTAGAKEYEIVPASGAVDPSQRHRRGTGERVWRLFSF